MFLLPCNCKFIEKDTYHCSGFWDHIYVTVLLKKVILLWMDLKYIEHLFKLENFEFYHDITKFVHVPGRIISCILPHQQALSII
jgi:hypothetical protein